MEELYYCRVHCCYVYVHTEKRTMLEMVNKCPDCEANLETL